MLTCSVQTVRTKEEKEVLEHFAGVVGCRNISLASDDTLQHHETRSTFGSGNGLMPDGTKPSPEKMLIYHH